MIEWNRCEDKLPEKSGQYVVLGKKSESGRRFCSVPHFSAKYWLWNWWDYMTMDEFQDCDKEYNDEIEYWSEINEPKCKIVEPDQPKMSDALYNALRGSFIERAKDQAKVAAWAEDFAERMAL